MNLRDILLTANATRIVLGDSNRTEQIHVVEETTGRRAFARVLARLRQTDSGQELLAERPELSSERIDYAALRRLPAGSLGAAYVRHLDDNQLSADSQATQTHHVRDPDIAYLMRRFRQTHDVWHPLTGLGVQAYQEVIIHAFSYGQLRLPVSAMVVWFGAIKHGLLERRWRMLSHTLSQAYRSGTGADDLIGVYWERLWSRPLDEVRRQYNITPIAS